MDVIFLFLLGFIFLVFILSIFRYKSPESIGKRGENYVYKLIRKKLDTDIYHLLENVTLFANKGTTQIDAIVVSKYGVFVIEVKTMSGWIFGNERQKNWTQTFRTGKKHRFMNPIRQNYGHVKTIQNLLGLKNNQVHNLVAFVGSSEFKTDMPENVTEGKEFIYYIQSEVTVIFTDSEVDSLLNTLDMFRLEDSQETNDRHIEYVEKLKRSRD